MSGAGKELALCGLGLAKDAANGPGASPALRSCGFQQDPAAVAVLFRKDMQLKHRGSSHLSWGPSGSEPHTGDCLKWHIPVCVIHVPLCLLLEGHPSQSRHGWTERGRGAPALLHSGAEAFSWCSRSRNLHLCPCTYLG